MNTVETSLQQPVDRRVADNEALILPFPSQEPAEGFFELEQSAIEPQAERNYVVDRKLLDVDTANRHGVIATEVFRFRNGKQLEVVTGRPKNQRSDVVIATTTALATSIRGHNWHNMHQALDLGYPYVLIGPEGGHAELPKSPRAIARFVRNLCTISMTEIAENMHEVLDVTDEDGFYEAGRAITIGESRAAMAAMGVAARAHKFGRLILYSDTTAPCFPKPRKDIQKHKALPLETVEQTSLFGQLPLKMSAKRYLHYPATLNPNPNFLLHVVGTIPTLLNGSAGRLAREIPLDAHMHNTLFTDDTWSDPESWHEIFAGHQHVVNTLRPGNHMAITNPRTLRERRERLGALRDELAASHNNADRINWNNVYLSGRLAVLGA